MFLWGNFSARDRLAKVSENMNSVKFEQQMLAFFFFPLEKAPCGKFKHASLHPQILGHFHIKGSSVSKCLHCQFHLFKFLRKRSLHDDTGEKAISTMTCTVAVTTSLSHRVS